MLSIKSIMTILMLKIIFMTGKRDYETEKEKKKWKGGKEKERRHQD